MDLLPLSLDPLPLRVEFPFQISLETINFFFSVSVYETLCQLWIKLESIKIFSDVIQSQKKFLLDERKKSWKKNKQTMLKKNRNFVSLLLYFNKKNIFCYIVEKNYYNSKNVYIDGYQTERGD